jgi:hypothetical protein
LSQLERLKQTKVLKDMAIEATLGGSSAGVKKAGAIPP